MKAWSQMSHAERLDHVAKSAEVYMRAQGSVGCTYADGDYEAVATRETVTVCYKGTLERVTALA